MWKSLKAASCRRTKSERSIFTQKTMATGWSREISYRSAKTRCKILSSARGCSLLAVCVNLSCLFKNRLGLIFFFRGLFFFRGFWNFIFRGNPRNRGKMGALNRSDWHDTYRSDWHDTYRSDWHDTYRSDWHDQTYVSQRPTKPNLARGAKQ